MLTEIELEILKILSKISPGKELTTSIIGNDIPIHLIYIPPGIPDLWYTTHCKIQRDLFIANKLGPRLSNMEKKGLVIGRKNPKPRRGAGSFWRLGPMSDFYKEQGILQ